MPGLPLVAEEPEGAVQRGSPAIDRLATVTADAATGTGTGVNSAVVLYSPGTRFDQGILALDLSNNFLEILSGANEGEYTVSGQQKTHIEIDQGSPDTVSFPLNTQSFPFRLSNEHFDGSVDSITQDDLYEFSDPTESVQFIKSLGVEAGWIVSVTSPAAVAGNYTITEVLTNDTLRLHTWPDTVDRSGMTYQLRDDTTALVSGTSSTTGKINVIQRGRVDGGTDFQPQFQNKQGDYLLVSGTQHLITEFINDDEFYIADWTGGTVGSTAAKSYRRLLDSLTGYLGVTGMVLTTAADHESGLSITNGGNALGPLLEDSQFKENYMVKIGGVYYQIADITGTSVTLKGTPVLEWGTTGTSGISYSFDHFIKKEQVLTSMGGQPTTLDNNIEFSVIDRRKWRLPHSKYRNRHINGIIRLYVQRIPIRSILRDARHGRRGLSRNRVEGRLKLMNKSIIAPVPQEFPYWEDKEPIIASGPPIPEPEEDQNLRGDVEVVIDHKDGKQERRSFKNTILRAGKVALAKSLANDVEDPYDFYISNMLFGTNGTTGGTPKFVDESRTGLFGTTLLTKNVISSVDETAPTTAIFTSVVTFTEGNGNNLNEMALRMADGDLYSMITLSRSRQDLHPCSLHSTGVLQSCNVL